MSNALLLDVPSIFRHIGREKFRHPLSEYGFLFDGQRAAPPDPVKGPPNFLAFIGGEAG